MNKDDKKAQSRHTTGYATLKRAEASIAWNHALVGRFYATGKRRVVQLSESAETDFGNILYDLLTSAVQQRADRDSEDAERFAAIFKLYYIHGLSAREIAMLHNMSVKAVESTLLRIMRRLGQSAKIPVES